MIRPWLHMILHLFVPGLVARLGFPTHWKSAWVIMLATMVVDLDHLLAEPFYDPDRCSIGFHPLHSEIAVAIYVLLVFFKPTRIVAIGLLIHMILDGIDCAWMSFELDM